MKLLISNPLLISLILASPFFTQFSLADSRFDRQSDRYYQGREDFHARKELQWLQNPAVILGPRGEVWLQTPEATFGPDGEIWLHTPDITIGPDGDTWIHTDDVIITPRGDLWIYDR